MNPLSVPDTVQYAMDWHRHSQPFRLTNLTLMAYDDPIELVHSKRLEFEAHVLSHRIAESAQSTTVTMGLDFPASPWQFFKQRHADSWWLGWLVRRRPVRTQRTTKTQKVTCFVDRFHEFPEAKIVVPPEHFGKPYVFDMVRWEEE